jgi:hypothetical protein
MGKASRAKGARRELELAKLLGGVKIPLSGAAGGNFSHDVVLPDGTTIEVKARADGFKQIYQWLAGGADLLALKADRQPWLIVMTLERFQELP